MSSLALQELINALPEIDDLEKSNPSPVGCKPKQPAITRVIGRSAVVLTCAHFERYIRSINEEAISELNASQIHQHQIPEGLRLLHSVPIVDGLNSSQWLHRRTQLEAFVASDAWLWQEHPCSGNMDHSRLVSWMKTPKPKKIIRYYRYWSIDDIFTDITRKAETRSRLFFHIDALVQKRNNIAHGDRNETATQTDIRRYKAAVTTFCDRADRALAKQISRLFGIARPW